MYHHLILLLILYFLRNQLVFPFSFQTISSLLSSDNIIISYVRHKSRVFYKKVKNIFSCLLGFVFYVFKVQKRTDYLCSSYFLYSCLILFILVLLHLCWLYVLLLMVSAGIPLCLEGIAK